MTFSPATLYLAVNIAQCHFLVFLVYFITLDVNAQYEFEYFQTWAFYLHAHVSDPLRQLQP